MTDAEKEEFFAEAKDLAEELHAISTIEEVLMDIGADASGYTKLREPLPFNGNIATNKNRKGKHI